jgi:peptidoglycan/xylan/chitin deacetylase (PgdA/CDA1 family)
MFGYKGIPIPVLMYHQVVAGNAKDRHRPAPYEVSLADFEAQLDFLEKNDFETLSPSELMHPSTSRSFSKNRKYVMITFDDGYLDNYSNAFPALLKRNFSATFFVIVNRIATDGFMSWEQLREMQQHGMNIQSHTLNHAPLATLADDAIHTELRDSRTRLAERLQNPVDFISFPHGSYDDRVLRAATAAGYAAWCTSDFGYVERLQPEPRIPRIIVRNNHSLHEFQNIVFAKGIRLMQLRAGAAARRLVVKAIGIRNYQNLYDLYYKRRPSQLVEA